MRCICTLGIEIAGFSCSTCRILGVAIHLTHCWVKATYSHKAEIRNMVARGFGDETPTRKTLETLHFYTRLDYFWGLMMNNLQRNKVFSHSLKIS